MKYLRYCNLLLSICLANAALAQQKLWTETDRQFTIDQFNRTRDEVVKETENLTPAQWAFRESSDRWSNSSACKYFRLRTSNFKSSRNGARCCQPFKIQSEAVEAGTFILNRLCRSAGVGEG
jgi:hypothetical protein